MVHSDGFGTVLHHSYEFLGSCLGLYLRIIDTSHNDNYTSFGIAEILFIGTRFNPVRVKQKSRRY